MFLQRLSINKLNNLYMDCDTVSKIWKCCNKNSYYTD
jgi:hypothetical protein